MEQSFKQNKSRHKKTIWIADAIHIARVGMRNITTSTKVRASIKEVGSFDELTLKCKHATANGQHFYIGDSQLSVDTGIVDIVQELIALNPNTHFLFLTNVDARVFESVAFESLKMTNVDCTFVSKDDKGLEQKIKEWLLSRKQCQKYQCEQIEERIVKDRTYRIRLSNQEFNILCDLLEGKSRQQLAECFQIKYPTVATYINRIYKKLGVRNINDLHMVATELGGMENMRLYK